MAAVLVHIDLEAGRPDSSSLVALAAGRAVASSWGATLCAAAIVRAPDELADTFDGQQPALPGLDLAEAVVARGGADRFFVATVRAEVAPLWATVGAAWSRVLDQLRPRLVLFGADAPSAAELGPRTAARLGARLLVRARATADGGDVELRDADGAHARDEDGGAVVALIGRADVQPTCRDRVDAVILPPAEPDARVELLAAMPADVAQSGGVLIAVGDDAARDPEVAAGARKLAKLVGGQLVGNAGAVRAKLVASGAQLTRDTPLAPELCIAIGDARMDLAGATSLVKLGAGKAADGALPGSAREGLADVLAKLEASR